MKLFFFTLAIDLKTALKTVAIPFFVLLAGLALGVWLLRPVPGQPVQRLSMAVENNDTHPVSALSIAMLSDDPAMSKAVAVTVVQQGSYDPADYDLVVVLPEGFLESVLRGDNLSPSLTVNHATPVEQVLITQLAAAAESYCAVFQSNIYAVLNAAQQSGLPPDRLDYLTLEMNTLFLQQFIHRGKAITPVITDPYGTGGATAFLTRGLLTLLLLSYAGVAAAALLQSLGLAKALRTRACGLRGDGICFAAGYLASAMVLAAMTGAALPLLAAAGTRLRPLPLALFLVLGVSLGGAGALAAGTLGGGVTAVILLVLPMGLLSGCLLPPELLPGAAAALAPLTLTYYGQALLTGREELLLPAALVALALTVLCVFLWKRRVRQ